MAARKSVKEEENSAAEEKLPPMSALEFKIFNRMAEQMDMFHNHFRQQWTLLYTAAGNNKRPRGMSIVQFLDTGLEFVTHLTNHHNIEERYFFPLLGKRMPEFRGDLQAQHKQIHVGLDEFEEYLKGCKTGENTLDMCVLKEHMNWGDVLWEHLDDEVRSLGAENMRKYWSKEEMMRLPM